MNDESPTDKASHSSRRALLKAGTLVLLLGAQQIARGASIVAVRVWPAQDYSRVTIESDTKLVTKHTFIETPPRLAVDIEGIDLNPQLKELVAKVRADDPNIAGIRVGQNSPGVVRMVMDLKHPARPQVFTLSPVAAYKHRLVFDLYPAQERDPLEALIAERLNDPKATVAQAPAPIDKPANAPHDPLGDLIAQRSEKPLQDRPTVAIAPPPAPLPPVTAAPTPARALAPRPATVLPKAKAPAVAARTPAPKPAVTLPPKAAPKPPADDSGDWESF